MDPVTLIVTALAAGATSAALEGVKDDVRDAVAAAYARLRGMLEKRFSGRPGAELALAKYAAAPDTWAPVLIAELTATGAQDDPHLVDAAQALLSLLDPAGARRGKYHVTISGGQGVQVGDRNTQTNTFYNR